MGVYGENAGEKFHRARFDGFGAVSDLAQDFPYEEQHLVAVRRAESNDDVIFFNRRFCRDNDCKANL